uniref:Zf_CCCH_5 domain-containing protein n=1 Tax=Caenorhabditis tropicalis TaxID=1561998 RepID=A0A1I7UGM0_9PELO
MTEGTSDDINGQFSQMSLAPEIPEKPNHEYYLNEFRVEACPLFKNHQCAQHRPFTCFKWHFPNQKRRRPIRTSDGQFNYSPDIYCDKYDESHGICPNGDE